MAANKDKDMVIQYDNGDFVSLASNIHASAEEAVTKLSTQRPTGDPHTILHQVVVTRATRVVPSLLFLPSCVPTPYCAPPLMSPLLSLIATPHVSPPRWCLSSHAAPLVAPLPSHDSPLMAPLACLHCNASPFLLCNRFPLVPPLSSHASPFLSCLPLPPCPSRVHIHFGLRNKNTPTHSCCESAAPRSGNHPCK